MAVGSACNLEVLRWFRPSRPSAHAANRYVMPHYPICQHRLKNRLNLKNSAGATEGLHEKHMEFQLVKMACPKRFELLTPRFVV